MSFPVRLLPYILLSLLAIFSLWKMLFFDGLPVGHDLTFEMVRLVEFKDALFSQILPRYAPHTYGGLGTPVFTFYAPLFSIGASTFAIVTGSLSMGVVLWFAILKILSVLSVYQLSRSLGKHVAFIISIVWCFLPYGFLDIYTRNAFAEATALYLLPLVCFGIWRLWKASHVTWKDITLCTLLLSAFFLSHNLTIVLCVFFAVIGGTPYVFWQLLQHKEAFIALLKKKRQNILGSIMSIVGAFGLTAWFLLPVLFEKNSVHLEELTTGKFQYTNNFADIGSILFDVQSLAFVGPAVAILLIAGLGLLLHKAYKKTLTSADLLLGSGVFLTSISVYFMTEGSGFIWEILTFFPLIQFPWRFQLFVSIGILLILGGIWKSLPRAKWLTYLFASLLLVQSISFGLWNDSLWQLQYSNFNQLSTSQIATENLRSTVGDEYISRAFDLADFPLLGTSFFQSKGYRTEITPFSTLYTSCRLGRNHLDTTTLLAYPFLTVESDTIPLVPENGYYAISPASDCIKVTLKFTTMQYTGILLFFLTLLFVLARSLISLQKRVK